MAASHARKRIWTPEVVRERIRTSMITRRLTDHVFGTVEMTTSQVTAALGLLRKTLPDLSQVDLKSAVQNDVADLNTDELTRRIAALEGAIETQRGVDQSPEVH